MGLDDGSERVSYDKEVQIEVLDLKKPLMISLKKYGINFLGDLVELYSDNDAKTVIKNIRHMGVVSYNAIGQWLTEQGLLINFVPVKTKGSEKAHQSPMTEKKLRGTLEVHGKGLIIKVPIEDIEQILLTRSGVPIFSIAIKSSTFIFWSMEHHFSQDLDLE